MVDDGSGLWARGLAYLFVECEECILVLVLLANNKSNRNLYLDTDFVLIVGCLVFQQPPHLTTVLTSSYHVC